MNSSKTFARRNGNGDLNGDLNGNFNRDSRRSNRLPSSTAGARRTAIFSALAALGLAGGLITSPSLASAAPGDPIGLVDFELPITFESDDLLPLDFELEPLIPGPGETLEIPSSADDDPECNEYAAANFSVGIDRYTDDPGRVEIRFAYTDVDVCDFTVWSAIAEPGAVVPIEDAVVGLASIADATESAGYHQQTFDDHDLCDLEIRVAVEESLAVTHPFADPGCETPVDGETPDDAPLQESPQVPSVGLPATGTDLTSVMFALGLITLGAGSVIALATRRREESSIL